jgi:hypothetical protein
VVDGGVLEVTRPEDLGRGGPVFLPDLPLGEQKVTPADDAGDPLGREGVAVEVPLVGGLDGDEADEFRVADEQDRREQRDVEVLQVAAVAEDEVEDAERRAEVAGRRDRGGEDREALGPQRSGERGRPQELGGQAAKAGEEGQSGARFRTT